MTIKHNNTCTAIRSTAEGHILLDNIVYGMPCFVFWKDIHCIYLGCNDLTANLLGLSSREEIVGKTDYDFGWDKEIVDKCRKTDENIIATGTPSYNVEEVISTKKKGEHILLTNKMPVFNQANKVVGIVGISIDITEIKRVELNLKAAKEAAEEANKAKSNFIGNMSHDIKTPLAGIIGMAEYLSYTLERPESIDFAQNIVEAGRQLLVFFDNCIEAIKIENTAITNLKERFSLKEVVDEIIAMFKPAIKNKALAAYVHYNINVPELFVGSRANIFRILMNLVGNAVKFTHIGSITLSVDLEENVTDSNMVKINITIADTGIGIPHNMHESIFDRFVALKPSNKGTPTTGSGLGLFLVKELVEMLRGRVSLTSQENHGSKFTVILPLEVAEKTDSNHEQDRIYLGHTQTHTKRVITGKTEESSSDTEKKETSYPTQLLLIEDNILAQKIAQSMLASLNCKVDLADCGGQALKLFSAGKYNLIFMDIGLPDSSGYELACHFRQTEKGSPHRAPIIALTAHVDDDIKKECIDAGMDDILSKPLSLAQARYLLNRYTLAAHK